MSLPCFFWGGEAIFWVWGGFGRAFRTLFLFVPFLGSRWNCSTIWCVCCLLFSTILGGLGKAFWVFLGGFGGIFFDFRWFGGYSPGILAWFFLVGVIMGLLFAMVLGCYLSFLFGECDDAFGLVAVDQRPDVDVFYVAIFGAVDFYCFYTLTLLVLLCAIFPRPLFLWQGQVIGGLLPLLLSLLWWCFLLCGCRQVIASAAGGFDPELGEKSRLKPQFHERTNKTFFLDV